MRRTQECLCLVPGDDFRKTHGKTRRVATGTGSETGMIDWVVVLGTQEQLWLSAPTSI